MAHPAAGTGIHGRDQLKGGGIVGSACRTRQAGATGFEGLAQHFERFTPELAELVEEQYAAVRK
jgi:hypothetical protein